MRNSNHGRKRKVYLLTPMDCATPVYLIYAVTTPRQPQIYVQVTALIVRLHLLASDHDGRSVAMIYLFKIV